MALAVGACVLVTGCGKPPRLSQTPDDKGGAPKGDPWDVAAKKLRKDTDLLTCKTVLGALNNDLAASEKAAKPAALTKEAADALAAVVPLSAEDKEEIKGNTFSSHDPVYLAECLYLRDAARSLALPGMPPEQFADLGFAWVCRQVYLNPWLMQVDQSRLAATALPPTYVLRRGYGSGLERMYVFLALLQQMGLDGCLIGPPDAGDKPAGFVVYSPDKKTVLTGAPRGPFWAVGVRAGNDIRLYDPWRGEAFPAPLNQLKANPEAHKAWFEDQANVSGVTPEEAKKATVYLAAPVNSLSPRMAMLGEKLKAEVDVKLAVNPAAVRSAFPDPKPAYWNPPNDRFAYGRAARTFLPFDQGGADRTDPAAGRLYDQYIPSQLPPAEQAIPSELLRNPAVIGDVKERIRDIAWRVYVFAFLDQPPTPRERIQRGQFQDAARTIVERQDEFRKSGERVRNTPDAEAQMREWTQKATQLYASLGIDPGARGAIDAHWKSQTALLLFDRAVSGVGQAEAAFLLALCKHEEAERLQARLERATGPDADRLRQDALDAWNGVVREWRTYRQEYGGPQAGLPGRAEHVKVLAARAEKLAQPR
jgi:hypothetical protein